MTEVWHKPLHRRRKWKECSFTFKIIYYMTPFVSEMINGWGQPLPFPTIAKLIYMSLITIIMLIPIIFPIVLILCTYAEILFVLKWHLNVEIPKRCDLIEYIHHIFTCAPVDKYDLFTFLLIERYRVMISAICSSFDYIRLIICIVSGNN